MVFANCEEFGYVCSKMTYKTLNYLYFLTNLSVKSLHSSESVSQSLCHKLSH